MHRVIAGLVIIVLATGCGGSAGAPTEVSDAPDAPPAGPVLDFSAIAGEWAGWGVETFPDGGSRRSWMTLDIGETAREFEQVGTFQVGTRGADGALVLDCSLSLNARQADPPEYRFRVSGGGCTPALLDVEHDAADEVLFVDVTADAGAFTASHVLEPGSDPGPAPQ